MAGRDVIKFEYCDDDGAECEGELPARFEVCSRCQGRGTHVNPNVDGHGITSEEWENEWDEESREMYMSGGYDVTCHECNGARVVLEVDEDACKRNPETAALLRVYHGILRDQAQYEAECRMERMMGA